MSQNEPPISLIIFDCDGVLVDSEILSQHVMIDTLKQYSINVDAAYFHDNFLGRSFGNVLSVIQRDFNIALGEDFKTDFYQALRTSFADKLQATAGIANMIGTLTVPYCIATSSPPDRARSSLSTTGLGNLFDQNIFTVHDVTRGKPAPDLFLYAAKTMGVTAEQCLVIEDSQSGIDAAVAANMDVIRYIGATHLQHLQSHTDSNGVPHLSHWDHFFTRFPQLSA